MGAVFQGISSGLGGAGAGYAAARDAAIQEGNDAKAKSFDMAMRVKDLLERQRMDTFNQQMQTRQAAINDAMLKLAQGGKWVNVGQPIRTSDGSYSVVERNDLTGEVRSRKLPDISTFNDVEQGLRDIDEAYFHTTGNHLPKELQDAYYDKVSGMSPLREDDLRLGLQELDQETMDSKGRPATAEEKQAYIQKWHRDTTAGLLSSTGLDAIIPLVEGGKMELPRNPKIAAQLADRIAREGGRMPAQLSPDKLKQYEDMMDSESFFLDSASSLQRNLPFLQDRRISTLVSTFRAINKLSHVLGAMYLQSQVPPAQQQIVSTLAADLDDLNEGVNQIRKSLGATAFRGTQGAKMLLDTLPQEFLPDRMNRLLLDRVAGLVKSSYNNNAYYLGLPEYGASDTNINVVNPNDPALTGKTK